MSITAIEDIDAFWSNLGNRNKLYKVTVDGKVYKDMELVYSKNEGIEQFTFKRRDKNE